MLFPALGLLITTCALTFSISGMWAEIVRPGDLVSHAMGGMNLFSDAGAYLASAHDQAKDGVWNSWALRRPIAAAFRSTLLFFAAFSLPVDAPIAGLLAGRNHLLCFCSGHPLARVVGRRHIFCLHLFVYPSVCADDTN